MSLIPTTPHSPFQPQYIELVISGSTYSEEDLMKRALLDTANKYCDIIENLLKHIDNSIDDSMAHEVDYELLANNGISY
ncbi:hypothetical protein NVP1121O_112 [Vibrio phage 1.121.O._10N.286.46.C4]|nr:hypothetical protein NVP1121O_112 [Vibrio phage 1.121.O._10N.286.46.C4]